MAEEKKAIAAFSRLSAADRSAIERLLSDGERRALRRALDARPPATPTPMETPSQKRPDLTGHSPWLAKRIVQLLSGKDRQTVTDAALEALRELATNRQQQIS